MKVKYKSKVSVLIAFIFIGTPLLCVLGAIGEGSLIGWVIAILTTALLANMYFQTYYEIDTTQATLRIKGGIMVHETLAIKDIRKIEETNNPLSAPALSIDRLEIHFNKFDSLLISPKNKKEFIADLQQINPEINYIPKKK